MKHLKHLLAALVFVSLIVFSSCGGGKGGDKIDPADEQAEKFTGTWSLVADQAKLVSASQSDWNGMTLTVTGDGAGGTFSTSGSQCTEVWPASGTWTFDGDDIGTAVRNDGVSLDLSTVTTSSLVLTFTINETTCTAPRAESVQGVWTFTFSK